MHSIRVSHPNMSFSSAHFVLSKGDCESLHGHNYMVEIFIQGDLDEFGMVMDFREVKRSVVKICRALDHKVILPGQSSAIEIIEEKESISITAAGKKYILPVEDCVILPIKSTTAEFLAMHILNQMESSPVFKITVCVSENIGSTACYSNKE